MRKRRGRSDARCNRCGVRETPGECDCSVLPLANALRTCVYAYFYFRKRRKLFFPRARVGPKPLGARGRFCESAHASAPHAHREIAFLHADAHRHGHQTWPRGRAATHARFSLKFSHARPLMETGTENQRRVMAPTGAVRRAAVEAAEYCLHAAACCDGAEGLIPRALVRHTENGIKRASGSSDGCNVLQHSWLTTHNLARERGRLMNVWY